MEYLVEIILIGGFFIAFLVTFIVMYFLGLFKENRFLSIKGRINRRKYLMIIIPCNILTVILYYFMNSYYIEAMGDTVALILIMLIFIMASIISITRFTFVVRRLHDLDHPLWLAIAFFIVLEGREFLEPSTLKTTLTIIFVVASLYLLCRKGTDGPNKYGADPLQQEKEVAD